MLFLFLMDKGDNDLFNSILHKEVSEYFDFQIININLDLIFWNCIPHSRQYPASVYMKILGLSYLPDYVEKIIYLDCDTLCFLDLSNLYHVKINTFIGGSLDIVAGPQQISMLNNLFQKDLQNYINTGVIIFNLELKPVLGNEFINFLRDNSQLFTFPDQDLINVYFYNQITIIDGSWNVIMQHGVIMGDIYFIIHMTWPNKWNSLFFENYKIKKMYDFFDEFYWSVRGDILYLSVYIFYTFPDARCKYLRDKLLYKYEKILTTDICLFLYFFWPAYWLWFINRNVRKILLKIL